MAMEKVVEQTVNPEVTRLSNRLDYLDQYYSRQFDTINKKIKVLVAFLIDKKVIGEQVAKAIQETKSETESFDKLIEWFMKSD